MSVALSGEMADVHLSGDNAAVLPTDTQKNTVFAFAQKYGIETAEHFAILLAQHFVDSQPTIHHTRVGVAEQAGTGSSRGPGARGAGGASSTATRSSARAARRAPVVVHYDGERTHVVSGLRDLVVLNSTASEFHGYIKDEFTTLPETHDRVLATAVTAQWRHAETDNAEIRDSGLRRGVRRRACSAARGVRRDVQPLAAADPLCDGHARARRVRGRVRGQARPPEQAPLRRGPQPVRHGEPERDLLRRRSAVRADRGARCCARTRPRPDRRGAERAARTWTSCIPAAGARRWR